MARRSTASAGLRAQALVQRAPTLFPHGHTPPASSAPSLFADRAPTPLTALVSQTGQNAAEAADLLFAFRGVERCPVGHWKAGREASLQEAVALGQDVCSGVCEHSVIWETRRRSALRIAKNLWPSLPPSEAEALGQIACLAVGMHPITEMILWRSGQTRVEQWGEWARDQQAPINRLIRAANPEAEQHCSA